MTFWNAMTTGFFISLGLAVVYEGLRAIRDHDEDE
jgi:hypothetical protein